MGHAGIVIVFHVSIYASSWLSIMQQAAYCRHPALDQSGNKVVFMFSHKGLDTRMLTFLLFLLGCNFLWKHFSNVTLDCLSLET